VSLANHAEVEGFLQKLYMNYSAIFFRFQLDILNEKELLSHYWSNHASTKL